MTKKSSPLAFLFSTAVATVALPVVSHAQVTIGNLTDGVTISGTSDGILASNTVPWTVAFTTPGGSSFDIASIDLALSNSGGDSLSLMPVEILATNVKSGGTVLQTFTNTQTTTTSGVRYTFSPTASFSFSSGTTYYMRLSGTNEFGWHHVTGDTVLSDYTQFSYGSTNSFSNQSRGGYLITSVAAIPEPGATAGLLGGLALASGLLMRRRRLVQSPPN